MTPSEKKPKPGDLPDPADRADCEEELDQAIADSMVASDPPAAVSKGAATAPPRGDNAAPSAKEPSPPPKKPSHG